MGYYYIVSYIDINGKENIVAVTPEDYEMFEDNASIVEEGYYDIYDLPKLTTIN